MKESELMRYLLVYPDHGDHVLVTPSRRGNGGGLVMLGRSDGVLCVPSAVRTGS